jgi:patatin-like phospholipase/acyl hydrolase
MDRIQKREKLAETPLRCEWFDLMVGTSTGGLIALMVGRLKMSVGAALEAYRDVAKEVFHTETRSWLNRLNPVAMLPRYSADKLEAAFQNIVKDARSRETQSSPAQRPIQGVVWPSWL